jgi:flap endonuclease GEN
VEIIEVDHADDPAAHPTILDRVEGKVLAVDLSLWIFHAVSQPELAELFSPEGQVAKVVFERALNWLRHGCVPIGVLDGVPPPEKLATMRLRHPGAVGTGGGEFRRLGGVAVSVLRAMGLPTFEAPGEAEATCAALNAAGAVDGCATSDGDAMLFGATNQFKQLKLSTEQPGLSRVERCDAAWVAETLGVDGDVPGALVALALLAGGDYDPGGADRVGSTLAMRVVKGLAAAERSERNRRRERPRDGDGDGDGVDGDGDGDDDRRGDDLSPRARSRTRTRPRSLPERLDAFLALPNDPELDALDKCTGCARCKHDGGGASKKKSCARGCAACGTEVGCVPRDGPCECPFHARADERWMNKVRRRARETEGYAGRFQRAARAYASQTAAAAAALPTRARASRRLRWRRRPDVDALAEILSACEFEPRRVREKVLPLLLEWDLRATAAIDAGDAGRDLARRRGALRDEGVEFVATRVVKAAGNKNMTPWRFLLQVDAADPVESEAAEISRRRAKDARAAARALARGAAGGGAEGAEGPRGPGDDEGDEDDPVPTQTLSQTPSTSTRDDRSDIVRDLEFLASKPWARSVRMSLVRETYPHLVRRWELETRTVRGGGKTPGAGTGAGAGAKREGASAGAGPGAPPQTPTPRTTSRGIPRERSPTQNSIVAFLSPSKSKPAASPGRSGDEPTPLSTPRRLSVMSVDSDGSEELAAAGLSPIPTVRRDRHRTARGIETPGGVLPTTPKRKPPTEDVVDLLTPSTSPRAGAGTGPGGGGGSRSAIVSPFVSPTKKPRRKLIEGQGSITAFLTPTKKPASTVPPVVDLCTPPSGGERGRRGGE